MSGPKTLRVLSCLSSVGIWLAGQQVVHMEGRMAAYQQARALY
jgi:hypothetical protein